ncbi:MAG: ABC transporter ATP-binding protein [Lachnospiraceae bacterium]|nr:ABC transporter ATP-binding protein [Lachnospiraceae bacterium]
MKSTAKGLINRLKAFNDNIVFCTRIAYRASKKYFVLRLLIHVLTSALPAVTVFVSKLILDELTLLYTGERLIEDVLTTLIIILVVYVAVRLIAVLLDKISDVLTDIHQDMISKTVTLGMMDKTNSLDLSFFYTSKFFDDVVNAQIDSYAIPVLSWTTISLVGVVVQLIISAAVMIKFNILFVILIFVLSIPSALVEKMFTGKIYQWNRNRAAEERKMNYTMYVSSDREFAKELRMYNLYPLMREKYLKLWNKWFKEKKTWSVKKAVGVTVFLMLPEIGIITVAVFLCRNIINHTMTIGDFELYIAMASSLTSSITVFIEMLIQLYAGDMKINNFKNFMRYESLIKDEGVLIPSKKPKIEFKNVSFKYPYTDKLILDNLSMSIEPGQKIALVGLNGSGKTTLIKLLLRFYDVTDGEILLDGRNIKEYSLKKLRRLFGVVFQDFSMYAFSAKDNITMSDIDSGFDAERFKNAAQLSEVEDFAGKWAEGYDTFLTKQFDEDGEELSGGQWQKIALARAFYKNAEFVILDEPNSSMDPEAEYKIFKQYDKIMKDKGAILISHRLSNVIHADKIMVLENGAILEEGTHNELISKDGRYAELFNMQSESYR